MHNQIKKGKLCVISGILRKISVYMTPGFNTIHNEHKKVAHGVQSQLQLYQFLFVTCFGSCEKPSSGN